MEGHIKENSSGRRKEKKNASGGARSPNRAPTNESAIPFQRFHQEPERSWEANDNIPNRIKTIRQNIPATRRQKGNR